MKFTNLFAAVTLALVTVGNVDAALVLNQAQPITHKVTVQPIVVSTTDGSSTATFFGNAAQKSIIEGLIDDIWAQAGIDIDFLNETSYNDDFAYSGTSSPRPTSDLSTIVNAGDLAGAGNANPLVLDMYLVNVAAGFSYTSLNTANGLAFVGGNGITQFVGSNLLTFTAGQEVIASVVAHEIGHNLGLPHIVEAENLMQAGGSPNQGERLNSAQISTATGSAFAIAVPEPGSFALVALVSGTLLARRRRC
jgi:hypothetical protein